ncbi:hypothetical protein [Rhodoferax sp.]|uniref:hypothetical protein n=1 Tax=Rhodoferax sp. TaxID=50421 RepID=UPI0026048648|nr:hypothetical protein [Rhodoferax sp.]MDD2920253.1 hypothetical protein [Rhodoferax sp.]
MSAAARSRADICIGGITVSVRSSDEAFLQLLDQRYAGFMVQGGAPDYAFDIELAPLREGSPDDDVRVYRSNGRWRLERGDFRAEWDPALRQGHIRQSANPYSIDTVLRIVHSLVLAREGGFLMHASSAVRNGKAFFFTGVSGAGKTTMVRLAPPDTAVLSDEISYLRKEAGGYYAYGTPFAGELARAEELARAGAGLRAPLEAVYLLTQGAENRVSDVGKAEAVRGILRNMLFFAEDTELVQAVFLSALELIERVPVRRLTFLPETEVWKLIQ